MNKVHYSSASNEWETPKDLFQKYNTIYNFELDAAATKENALCKNFFTKEQNSLIQEWSKYKTIWCNPPYSNLKEFIKKAYDESLLGCNIVMLIPARTDIIAFHDYIIPFVGINSNHHIYSWAAGIVDGEGCIRISKNVPSINNQIKNNVYSLILSVKMTDEVTVSKLHKKFNVGNITTEDFDYKKTTFRWESVGIDAFDCLKLIYPYLITKKSQAFRGMEFQIAKGLKGKATPSIEYLEKGEYYYNLLKNLKVVDTKQFITAKIEFIRGRVKFINKNNPSGNPAPFPSCIVVFGEK